MQSDKEITDDSKVIGKAEEAEDTEEDASKKLSFEVMFAYAYENGKVGIQDIEMYYFFPHFSLHSRPFSFLKKIIIFSIIHVERRNF